RQFEIDVLEIVLACPADDDRVAHSSARVPPRHRRDEHLFVTWSLGHRNRPQSNITASTSRGACAAVALRTTSAGVSCAGGTTYRLSDGCTVEPSPSRAMTAVHPTAHSTSGETRGRASITATPGANAGNTGSKKRGPHTSPAYHAHQDAKNT